MHIPLLFVMATKKQKYFLDGYTHYCINAMLISDHCKSNYFPWKNPLFINTEWYLSVFFPV